MWVELVSKKNIVFDLLENATFTELAPALDNFCKAESNQGSK